MPEENQHDPKVEKLIYTGFGIVSGILILAAAVVYYFLPPEHQKIFLSILPLILYGIFQFSALIVAYAIFGLMFFFIRWLIGGMRGWHDSSFRLFLVFLFWPIWLTWVCLIFLPIIIPAIIKVWKERKGQVPPEGDAK